MSVTRISLALLCASLSAFIVGSTANAALINMTAGNSLGQSSFNSATGWSNSAAPTAGNDYTNSDSGATQGFLLRTPGSAGNFTFGGDSLTITGFAGAPTLLNQALLFKGAGGSAVAPNVITVNNLILSGLGYIRHGSGDGDFFALAGGLTINGGAMTVQGPTFIQSVVGGSGSVNIDAPGSNDPLRVVHFTNGANTFTGNIVLTNANNGTTPSRFELDSTGNLNFVIGANGVNNSVTGTATGANGNSFATYDGTFDFNLAGADNTIGDVWNVATGGTQTYTSTFTVAGFTGSQVTGIWDTTANGVDYQFNQATGQLSVVPEPSTLLLAGLGLLGFVGVARRKKETVC